MKTNDQQPGRGASPEIETFGGAYHRLESTFRPRNESRAGIRPTEPKKSNLGKGKRKQ